MKVSEIEAFQSKFAKVGEDIKHNAVIKIKSQMEERDGKDFHGNPAKQYTLDIEIDENGEDKIFQLNATNAKAIAEIYGDDDSGWVGKEMVAVLIPDSKAKSGKRAILTAPKDLPEVQATQ